MMRYALVLAVLHLGCSADTAGPGTGDAASTIDTGGTKEGGVSACSTEKCSATDKCWPASCTGAACGGMTVSVPAESRCLNGCCETLEQSCDRVCP